jgi:hypothetical protein
MTHDYKRHGTTTLFAALDVAIGKVIGECLPRHHWSNGGVVTIQPPASRIVRTK